MRTNFGRKVRNSLPAIGLGLLTSFGLISVTLVTAPAAVAQKASSAEFAKAYTEMKSLMDARKYSEAIPKIDAAAALAKTSQEKHAIAGARVLAYHSTKNYAQLIKAIEAHMALGGLSAQQTLNYKRQLAGAYSATRQNAKAVELTKEVIASGSGTAQEHAFVASNALAQKQYDDAIKYAQQAIAKSGARKSPEHYNIILAAYRAQGKNDQYYDTLLQVAKLFNNETHWRTLVERAKSEPRYRSNEALLDVYHALEATGVKLTNQEKLEMGEAALTRGIAIEAEKVLGELFKSGAVGGSSDRNADRNKRLYERAQADAKAAKAGGLERMEAEAATKPTGDAYAAAASAYLANGDEAKAIELFQKALAKGEMEPGMTELVKLRLGVAQYKAGQKDAARKTWADVKGDNGAGWLAKVWTARA